ncbi:hypothetical protein IID20_00655 [Patescibacteria group bacterium]|nr:hypothetical protein [Patescibacteria group bacterium]
MPPQIFPYIVNQKIQLTHDVVGLNLVPQKGQIFDFKPGQFVMLVIYNKQGKVWHQQAFSICSSPSNKDYLQLAVKVYGKFSQKAGSLKKGDQVGISGPYGVFTFETKEMKEVIFLAGGIGITPFISAIRYAENKNLENKLTLFYSNKTKEDIAFSDELKILAQNIKNFKVNFLLTQKAPEQWDGEKCRIDQEILKNYCLPFKGKYFFLCGPLGFIETIDTYLRKLGVSQNYIKVEKWY